MSAAEIPHSEGKVRNGSFFKSILLPFILSHGWATKIELEQIINDPLARRYFGNTATEIYNEAGSLSHDINISFYLRQAAATAQNALESYLNGEDSEQLL